jgi:ubiquinone/menaquinone biosynthesis C-methylase UbiE
MSEEMYDEGYQKITNVDSSQIVIKAMQEKYKDKAPNFQYVCMDVRQMDFESGSFDCVVARSGVSPPGVEA